jgi:hypothetical protein
MIHGKTRSTGIGKPFAGAGQCRRGRALQPTVSRPAEPSDITLTDDQPIQTKPMPRRYALILAALILAGCGNPDKAWQLAERDDTPTAYLEFLAKYPDGERADQARARIEDLKVIRAWERAEFKAAESDYRDFIDKYPDSEFVAAAEERILTMQRDADWEEVLDIGSDVIVAAFLERYPDAPQTEEARELLAALQAAQEELVEEEPPAERDGNFRLQLAVFRTPDAAESEVRRLATLFPDTFFGPIRIETPQERGSGKLFRLLSVPMTGEEARGVCDQLKKRRQDCLIINR